MVVFSILLVPSQASAQGISQLDDACRQVQQSLDQAIVQYNQTHDQFATGISQFSTTMKSVVELVRSNGYDASKLDSDSQIFTAKANKSLQSYQIFIQALESAKQNNQCGSGSIQYLAAVIQALTPLNTLVTDLTDLKNFYESNLRPDVEAIKAQLPKY